MKRSLRVLKLGAAGLLLALFAAGALVFWSFAGEPLPDGADLPGGARLIKDGFVAFFLIPAGKGTFVLIDCGIDPSGKALKAELARRGAGLDAVKAAFLTHGHGDHVAGCHLLPSAEILSMPEDVALAAGTAVSNSPVGRLNRNEQDRAAKVKRTLKDGETVQVGELSVQAFAVPGHTSGSAVFLAGEVLYLGDSAVHAKDDKLKGSPWLFSESVEQNHRSLRALQRRFAEAKAKVVALAFAHFAPMNGTKALEDFAAEQD
jgi:glyoxylase-like metal-dependent hydrolase (beta-lactamase superfamily II)